MAAPSVAIERFEITARPNSVVNIAISIDRDAPSFGLLVALLDFLESSEEAGDRRLGDRRP